jgi:Cu-Zn family superoxide dismutase
MAVAVFTTSDVIGTVIFEQERHGIRVWVEFTKLPSGLHGFHIHKAGDLRGSGCAGACEHWSLQPAVHGGPPEAADAAYADSDRHTGDLGNIEGPNYVQSYFLRGVVLSDLYGRSMIVHADPDDLGHGNAPDSKTTGNSGARIACAVIGRIECRDSRDSRDSSNTKSPRKRCRTQKQKQKHKHKH